MGWRSRKKEEVAGVLVLLYKHQQSPRRTCCAAACCGLLQAVGGGYPVFPKAAKAAKPRTKHKGVHLPTPCKDGHNRNISWVVLMPSPIAHCKQSVVLLVVSLFLLGCVVPSSVGSTVDIRRQSEENHDLSKHSTAQHSTEKKEKISLDCVPLSLPALLQIASPRT